MNAPNLLDLPLQERRQIIREKLAAKPSGMTVQLARELNVPEIEVIRALPNGNVVELDGNFSTWGDFFNVQTASLDMHIRHKQLAGIFAVTKPGHMDAVPTVSIQFYDQAGNSAFKVFFSFGGKPPSAERMAKFNEICGCFGTPHPG